MIPGFQGVRFQVSGVRRCQVSGTEVNIKSFMDVQDLEVYQKLCRLHIEICDLSHAWPSEEKYEIGSQVRRSSNSSPAQLAEKNDDRDVRNKIEGVNRSRGEAAETIHHLFMAREKGYITAEVYGSFRQRYKECIRMLNGLERTLERKLPEAERRWVVREYSQAYNENTEPDDSGWPLQPETRHPKPDT
jgi:four helix bundle protein